MIRIGHGFDAHALSGDRRLVLGGVVVPHSKGLRGHSDADVLIHAICDACLGAAGLGDIGRHFPAEVAKYKDIDSRVLLREVKGLIGARGWTVVNVDGTIVAQAPRLADYLPAMQANIAADLGVDQDWVNIKATTTDGLGYSGREEGIAAHAVVLIANS